MRTRIQKGAPTPGDVHINAPLSNISVAYVLDQSIFIADQVFPVVPVSQQSNLYYLFDKGDFLRDEAKPRAPGTESAGGAFNLTTQAYACLVEAYHKDIDDQLRANADTVLSLDMSTTQLVTQKLLIRRERKWMTTFFKSGVWGTDITGVASAPSGGQTIQWNQTASDPVADVEAGKMAILAATGFAPNVLVLGAQVLSALRNNTRVRDTFKYTSAESIDKNMLAGLFGVERVLVSQAVYDSAQEGAASSVTFAAGKHALLCYAAPSPSLMQPTAGYTFAWSGFTGGASGWRIKRFRVETVASDRIEGEMAFDMKIVAAALGYFFSGIVA